MSERPICHCDVVWLCYTCLHNRLERAEKAEAERDELKKAIDKLAQTLKRGE